MEEKVPRMEQNRGEIRFRVIKTQNLFFNLGCNREEQI